MRKIIRGKSYDTDTAKLVGWWDNGDYGNFGYVAESLYRKRTGEYFLHGEGGARPRYAGPRGSNSWDWGETITPLEFVSAEEWAKGHLSAAEYDSEFGGTGEGGKQLVSLRLSASAYAKLSRLSSMQGEPKSAIIEDMLANA